MILYSEHSETARSRLNSLLFLAVRHSDNVPPSVVRLLTPPPGILRHRCSPTKDEGKRVSSNGVVRLVICALLLSGPRCSHHRRIGWQGGLWMKAEAGSTELSGDRRPAAQAIAEKPM